MPVNEVNMYEEPGTRLPCQAKTAVTGKRFVAVTGPRLSGPGIPATAQVGASDPTDGGRIQVGAPAAAGHVLGVAMWDAAIGEGVTVITDGVAPVNAAATMTAGTAVQVDATGSVVALAAGIKVGTLVDAVTSGNDAQVKIVGC
jgi:predicted RecA/RadA family phage recombinase